MLQSCSMLPACTGQNSSNIAASKVTRSETLSTNKTYQLIKETVMQAKQANLGVLHAIKCTQHWCSK